MRWLVIDVTCISFEVRRAPGKSPSCLPIDVSRVTTLSPSAILVFDVMRAGSGLLKDAEHLLHTIATARQVRDRRRTVIDVILSDEFVQDSNVAFIDSS